MFTKIAQTGLRLIGAGALLSAGATFVAPSLEAAAEQDSHTTAQNMKLPSHAEYKAMLAANITDPLTPSASPITTTTKPYPTKPVSIPQATSNIAASATPTFASVAASTPIPTSSFTRVAVPVAAPAHAPENPPAQHNPAPAPKPTPKPTPTIIKLIHKITHTAHRDVKVAAVLAFARAQIGLPYIMGAEGPHAWDCSGLTMQAFHHVGINIGGHGVHYQWNLARAKGYLVPWYDKKPGDLVFYGTPGGGFSHVAIYSGNGRIIEAANPARPVIERPYWGQPYHTVARFIR